MLLVYIIAALVWWFISLEKQNAQMKEFHVKQLNATIDSLTLPELYRNEYAKVENEYKRGNIKFLGEGVTFLLLTPVGAAFVYRLQEDNSGNNSNNRILCDGGYS